MKCRVHHDDVRSFRCLAGQLHRGFGGFGPGVAKEELIDTVGGDFVEAVCELAHYRVAVTVHLRMDELCGLFLNGRNDFRVTMAGARDRDTRREIKVFLPVGSAHVAAAALNDG